MLHEFIAEALQTYGKAFYETFQMVGISLASAVLLGVPIGLFLFVTSRGLFLENRFVNAVSGLAVNVIRSVPFVILLVLLLPFTKLVAGTRILPGACHCRPDWSLRRLEKASSRGHKPFRKNSWPHTANCLHSLRHSAAA